MTAVPGTVQMVLGGLRGVFAPLSNRLTIEQAPAFLARLGVPVTAAQAATLATPLESVRVSVSNYVRSVDELDRVFESGELDGLLSGATAAIAGLARLFDGLPALGTALGALPGAPPDFAEAFPRRLFDHLVTAALSQNVALNEILEFTGILERDDVEPPDPAQDPYTVDTLHIGRIGGWLGSPGAQLASRFDWDAPGFDGTKLLTALDRFFAMLGLPVLLDLSGSTPVLDLGYLTIRPRSDVSPPGIAITFDVDTQPVMAENTGPDWKLTAAVEFALPRGTEIVLQPGGATVHLPEATTAAGLARFAFVKFGADGNPLLLFGSPGGSRLEAYELGIELAVGLRSDGAQARGDIGVRGTVSRGKLIIDLSAGDGFLTELIPVSELESDVQIGFGYSSGGGLRFDGSGGLEIQLPTHLDLGPVEVTGLTLATQIEGNRLPAQMTVDITAGLGPLTMVVEGVGLGAELALVDDNKGNLGPLDLTLAFRPPTGVGLAVDAGLVAGGGFLSFDPATEEYAGILELELAGFIEVKAIGLITTRMPEGQAGFSLLLVITAEFGGGGIQLGLGFTLLAVGGLIGLNRGMDLNALAEGVRTGAVESVMFPRDVIANAPRIISDLRRFFPPEDGTFLVGPMAKIGWGTPALVTVSLGVIVEIPPGTVAIVGVLECVLPARDLPLLVLKINFIGALEPDKQRMWFFAQLFESRILFMTIDGGMGLLVEWGDDPDLVLTVGGFHPSFRPPPLPFPVPPRISVDVLNRPGQLIRVSGYFAVTSNTAQFGARAELRLGFNEFGVQGHLAFDALFQFSPFRFLIQISASVSLRAGGIGLFSIHLRFALEGPAPWRAKGRGSISLLFFEISADFDISWGEDRNPTLPPVEVLPLLAAEISKIDGWETRLPPGGIRELVTLRTLDENEDDLVLHPRGTLVIRQRAIPLDVRIDRVGAQRPGDGVRFSVAPALDSGLDRVAFTGDKFAMAQFQDMDEAAKLTRPAYENQDAGLELAAAGGTLASVRVVRRSARYEQIVIDGKRDATGLRNRAVREVSRTATGLVSVSPVVFQHLANGSSTSRSPLARQTAARRQPFAPEDGVRIEDQRYVIAYRRNNGQALPPSVQADRRGTSTFRNRATAVDALADWVTAEPGLADTVHVIPVSEMTGELAVAGSWTEAGALPAAVSGAEPVRLGTGTVLLAGGSGADGKATTATALFDPVADTWSAGAPLATARRGHSTTKLADGRVLVVGGVDANGSTLDSAEIYDPVARAWTALPDMATARHGHSAIVLPGGGVLVAGGTGKRGERNSAALDSAEILTFQAGAWSWQPAAPMNQARTGHRAVLVARTVLVVGGELTTGGAGAALAGCETFDPVAGTWRPTDNDLTTPRRGHQATLLADGSVLVVGGDPVAPRLDFPEHDDPPFRPDGLAAAERYDPVTRRWRPVADLPGGRTAAAAVALRNGRALVIGGTGGPARDAGYRAVASHNPVDGGWTAAQSLAVGRWDVAAVELADGRVLVAGGRTRAGTTAGTETFHP